MACVVLLSFVYGAEINDFDKESDLETRALRDFYPKDPNLTNEKQLVSIAQIFNCLSLSRMNTIELFNTLLLF